MKTQHTLSSVQSDFALWRQNKASPRERIPEALKRHAVSLLSDNSPSNITNTLSISRTMFKRWQETLSPASSDEAIQFISLPMASTPEHTSEALTQTSLSLTQPNGNQWSLNGELSPSQLTAFVHAFASV